MDPWKIEIVWEGPYDPKRVMSEFSLDNEKRVDFGLYMIYGPHPLYSNKKRPQVENVLLYVGKTVRGSKFAGRIKKHGFCHDPHVLYEIYLGRIEVIEPDPRYKKWVDDVGDSEKLLINKYAPPFNACHTGDIRYDQLSKQNISIKNSGEFVDLDPTIDSNDVVYLMQRDSN